MLSKSENKKHFCNRETGPRTTHIKNTKNVPQVAQIIGSATIGAMRHAWFQSAEMTKETVTDKKNVTPVAQTTGSAITSVIPRV